MAGEVWARRNRIAEAEEAFRDAAKADPKATEPRSRLVFLLTVQDRPDEARPVLWELYRLTRDPRHLVTLAGLAGVEAEADARSLEPDLDHPLPGPDPRRRFWLHAACAARMSLQPGAARRGLARPREAVARSDRRIDAVV